jgi:hypothetical protein
MTGITGDGAEAAETSTGSLAAGAGVAIGRSRTLGTDAGDNSEAPGPARAEGSPASAPKRCSRRAADCWLSAAGLPARSLAGHEGCSQRAPASFARALTGQPLGCWLEAGAEPAAGLALGPAGRLRLGDSPGERAGEPRLLLLLLAP